jgi:hypothetical protein
MAVSAGGSNAEKRLMPMRFLETLGMILIVCGACADRMIAAETPYDSHGKRDPFIPAAQVAPLAGSKRGDVDTSALEAWFGRNLGGIIWDQENPYALIQDEIVAVGGEVRGCTIVEIKPEGIVFSYGKKRVEVPLKEYKKEEKKKGERQG